MPEMWDYAYNETGGQGFLISISENSAAEEILGGVTRDSHSRGVSLAIFPLQEEYIHKLPLPAGGKLHCCPAVQASQIYQPFVRNQK